jgi:hypothetical protein
VVASHAISPGFKSRYLQFALVFCRSWSQGALKPELSYCCPYSFVLFSIPNWLERVILDSVITMRMIQDLYGFRFALWDGPGISTS